MDVGESGSAAADLGGHPAGAGVDALDRIHVEVGEGGAAHLGIADVGAVHGKGGFNAALAVDGELRGEVGGAVGVGHGAGGQQQQRAEVALVEGQFADGLAGKLFAAGRGLVLFLRAETVSSPRAESVSSDRGPAAEPGRWAGRIRPCGLLASTVRWYWPAGKAAKLKLAIRAGDCLRPWRRWPSAGSLRRRWERRPRCAARPATPPARPAAPVQPWHAKHAASSQQPRSARRHIAQACTACRVSDPSRS